MDLYHFQNKYIYEDILILWNFQLQHNRYYKLFDNMYFILDSINFSLCCFQKQI